MFLLLIIDFNIAHLIQYSILYIFYKNLISNKNVAETRKKIQNRKNVAHPDCESIHSKIKFSFGFVSGVHYLILYSLSLGKTRDIYLTLEYTKTKKDSMLCENVWKLMISFESNLLQEQQSCLKGQQQRQLS